MKMRVKIRFYDMPGRTGRKWVGHKHWQPYFIRSCWLECPGQHADVGEWHHGVYEAIRADGQILYIGRSKTVSVRLSTHRRAAPWWPDADRFLVTLMPCYSQSKGYERYRIRVARPLFNVPEADYIRRGVETRKRNAAAKAAS